MADPLFYPALFALEVIGSAIIISASSFYVDSSAYNQMLCLRGAVYEVHLNPAVEVGEGEVAFVHVLLLVRV